MTRPYARDGGGTARLSEIVRAFKTFSARQVNAWRGTPRVSVWQRNDYEHIIRDDEALDRIREHIATNPARWVDDKDNPENVRRIRPRGLIG